MIWFLMLFDTFFLEKIFSTIHFLQCLFLSTSLSIYLMQLEITTIIQLTIIYVHIFSQFSILYIFIFYAKVIFSGFLSCIFQLFTVFWKFLSCIVLFFHEILYYVPVLLKKNYCGRPVTETSEQRLNVSRQCKCRGDIGYCPREAQRAKSKF